MPEKNVCVFRAVSCSQLHPKPAEIWFVSPPTHHPGPSSHRAMQEGREVKGKGVKQGQLQGQTWLYPVWSSNPLRMETAQSGHSGVHSSPAFMENKLHLIPRYWDAGCRIRAPKHPEDYSGFVAKFRSWFFTYHLTVFIMLCYSQHFTVTCLLQRRKAPHVSLQVPDLKQFGMENSWCCNKSLISTNLGLLNLFIWLNRE